MYVPSKQLQWGPIIHVVFCIKEYFIGTEQVEGTIKRSLDEINERRQAIISATVKSRSFLISETEVAVASQSGSWSNKMFNCFDKDLSELCTV